MPQKAQTRAHTTFIWIQFENINLKDVLFFSSMFVTLPHYKHYNLQPETTDYDTSCFIARRVHHVAAKKSYLCSWISDIFIS